MLKIQELSKVWASKLALFLFVFLVLGAALASATEAFGQNHGATPQCGHTISKGPPNPTTTPDLLCAHASGAVFDEDPMMADVTVYVSTQEELYEALKSATGGETILLAPGDYGAVSLSAKSGVNIAPTSQITIKSLDPENSASFSELHLNGISNYTFSNLIFDYTFSEGDPHYYRPFEVNYSSSIQIVDSVFDGDVAIGVSEAADGFGYAYGLSVRGSENINISDNEFTTWMRGAVFTDTQNLVVSGNEVHSIRSDGMDFVQVSNALIEKNYIHDFETSPESGDHVDYIQFWTNGTLEPSTNIVIRQNVLDMGDGGMSQSIFMRNEEVDTGRAGLEMYYLDVVIEQNLILGGHLHGITVGATSGLLIQGNTILAAPDPESTVNVPMINVSGDSFDVSIIQNAVARINGYVDQSDWNISGNAFIQNTDPNAPGYYSDVFVESSMFGPNGVVDYVVAPGSMLENLQAGYSGLFSVSSNQSVRALFDVATSPDDLDILILDGRYSFGNNGTPLPDGTTFTWQIDAGETYDGPVLSLEFANPGRHFVQLLVTTPDGSVSVASALVHIAGSDLLSFDNQTGGFLIFGYGETEMASESNLGSSSLPSGSFALDLGEAGTQMSVSRQSIERIFGAESFALTFSLQADTVGARGEVFRLHSSFVANISATGEIQFQFFSDIGEKIFLVTSGAGLNDGAIHDVSVVLDDAEDSLSIFVDGSVLAKTVVVGDMPDMGSWDLAFGNPWGGENFDGKIHSFDSDVSNRDYPVYSEAALNGFFADVVLVEAPTTEIDFEPEIGSDQPAELDGYSLDFLGLKAGTEGSLIGNAYVDTSGFRPALALDGKNDSARLGSLDEFTGGSQLTVEIDFVLGGDGEQFQSLFSDSTNIRVVVDGDSIHVLLGGSSRSFSPATYTASNLSLADLDSHSLRVIADADIDRVQLLLDGSVVLDSSDQAFAFGTGGQNWWSKGWAIGDGDRRSDDFEGLVTNFAVDDTSLFVGV
jgi:hypothetical protein